MTPNAGILTQLLQAFLTVFNGGWASLQPSAMSLFGILVGIELTLSGLWWAMSGNDAVKALVQKLLVIGLFLFIIQQWQMLTTTTLQSFARAGAAAGGGNLTGLSDPSTIVAQGLTAIQPLSDKVDALTQGTWTALKNLGTIMQLGLAMIGILFSFFLLGIQCFLVYVEFYIVAVLSLILLPFGVMRHTAFLAEKAFGAVLAHGVKLMVLAFIIAIAQPVLQQITLSTDFSLRDAWCTLLAAMAICFLAWHAPGMAAGLLAGTPSLSAGHVAGAALETGGAIALGAAGSIAAGRAIAGAAGPVVQAASALKTGMEVSAGRAAEAGSGPLGQVASGFDGAGKVAASSLTKLGDRMRQRIADGKLAGLAAVGADSVSGREASSASPTPTSGSPAADGGSSAPLPAAPPSAGFSSSAPSASPSSAAQRDEPGATSGSAVADGAPVGAAHSAATTLDAAHIAPGQRRVDDTVAEGLSPNFAAGAADGAIESATEEQGDDPAPPSDDFHSSKE